MTLKDIKIGEKFTHNNKTYLRIDMDVSTFFINSRYDGIICALDMETFKVMCFSSKEITK